MLYFGNKRDGQTLNKFDREKAYYVQFCKADFRDRGNGHSVCPFRQRLHRGFAQRASGRDPFREFTFNWPLTTYNGLLTPDHGLRTMNQ